MSRKHVPKARHRASAPGLQKHLGSSSKTVESPGEAITPHSARDSDPTSASETITVSKTEYESLLKASEELASLKELLEPETSESQSLLSSSETDSEGLTSTEEEDEDEDDESIAGSSDAPAFLDDSESMDGDQHASPVARRRAQSRTEAQTTEPVTARYTITIETSAPVTHADIAAAVRGGSLAQIFIGRRQNMANVSFIRTEDAGAFMHWVQRFPLIVAGKRAKVSWAPRSWEPPAYIRRQVKTSKLTRNIIINRARPNITEAVIRRDLHHIHNLAVISVQFDNGSVYISTNCVAGALFAKTCLMSRSLYQGLWIGFYPDECAEPLPFLPSPEHVDAVRIRTVARERGPRYNPFELLTDADMVPGEEGDDDEDESGTE